MILIACFFTSTEDIKITIRALYKHIFLQSFEMREAFKDVSYASFSFS